jgi:hypothetical protein
MAPQFAHRTGSFDMTTKIPAPPGDRKMNSQGSPPPLLCYSFSA